MRVAVQVLVGTVQSLVTLPWFLLRSRWQLARFDEHFRHVVLVEPGPGGRPGERVVAHSPRVWQRLGSSLTAKCVGLASERGQPGPSARETLEHFWAKGWETLTPMVVEQIGGEEAFRYHLAAGRTQLTEWKRRTRPRRSRAPARCSTRGSGSTR